MQIFPYYLLAWTAALGEADPPTPLLGPSDLIVALLKRTAGLPLIRLAGWRVALGRLQSGLWTAADLWAKSLAVPGWRAGVGPQQGPQTEAWACN